MGTVVAAAALGEEALAAYQMVNAGWNFVLNILDSVAIAAQTLVGARLGAGDREGARSVTWLSARAGIIVGAVIGVAFALASSLAPLFSESPGVQQLVVVGMIAASAGFPLEGWMWALDGILIGAGDFRYLAKTCAGVSAAYLVALALFALVLLPRIDDGLAAMAALWLLFDFVLMGGRAVTNGLRARGDGWMEGPMAP